MDDDLQAEIDSARRTVKEKNMFKIEAVDNYLEATYLSLTRGWITISTKLRKATTGGIGIDET